LIAGFGTVNGDQFDEAEARCMVMAYDFTVLAGTQGYFNHKKADRVLHLAGKHRTPLVLFAEGGGGRPGDTDADGVMISGLDLTTFSMFINGSHLTVPLFSVVLRRGYGLGAMAMACGGFHNNMPVQMRAHHHASPLWTSGRDTIFT